MKNMSDIQKMLTFVAFKRKNDLLTIITYIT